MKVKASEFIKWVESKVGCPYLWGGQGETLFDMVRKYCATKSQSNSSTEKMINFLKRKGVVDKEFYDCSGLGVKFLLDYGALKHDTTADGLYRKCVLINEEDVRAGDWAFFLDGARAYHIGYMVTDDMVVHALDQEVGVVKEKLSARKEWVAFGRPDFCMEYDIPIEIDFNNLRAGDKITTTKDLKGYNNAENAVKGVKPVCTYAAGVYYVYKVSRGAVNITRHKGIPGAWVVL